MADLSREDTPSAIATPTQARLARERIERMKRLRINEPPPPAPPPPPPEPKPEPPPPEPVVECKPEPPPVRFLTMAQWLEGWRGVGTTVPPTANSPSCQQIQQATAKHFNLTRKEMLGRARAQRFVRARQIGMFLCLEMIPPQNVSQVGRWFNRDHTTVLHARAVVSGMIISDPEFADKVDEIRREVRAGSA